MRSAFGILLGKFGIASDKHALILGSLPRHVRFLFGSFRNYFEITPDAIATAVFVVIAPVDAVVAAIVVIAVVAIADKWPKKSPRSRCPR